MHKDTQPSTFKLAMIVVFGRPGAGKSTLSEEAVRLLKERSNPNTYNYLHLDLDVCVPQWMRDNFAKGIYPTLQQRETFIVNACQYVTDQIQSAPDESTVVIIAFSFVNTDMRVVFRQRFPHAKWILVDTKEDVAQERILARQGHFYKVAGDSTKNRTSCAPSNGDVPSDICNNDADSGEKNCANGDKDNSEWEFQPVTFPHTILDGNAAIVENANRIVDIIIAK